MFIQLGSCSRVADDDWILATGFVISSLAVQGLSNRSGWSHHLGPVVGNVLVVRIVRALQLLGANVTEHDSKCKETEHTNHQKDIYNALRLNVALGSGCMVHCLLGSVVLGRGVRQYTCVVEAVLQEGEKERLQLGGVDVWHGWPLLEDQQTATEKEEELRNIDI